MDPVKRQYETYPYPERDPAEEATRLIEGSPSHPVEIDHFLFRGQRDWSRPFRALVAGGGTGDGLIMMAQKLADIGCPAEITYLDMSQASRAIAEARARVRGLDSIRFLTGDLLTAPELGPFDYIDCCGVLHHLPAPDQGFAALAEALDPQGGMGLMVYAPYGRTGVYPMQAALAALVGEDLPTDQLRLAREVLGALPETNWLARNPLVADHKSSEAGLYDLLLHSRDRAYGIDELAAALARAGLAPVGLLEPAQYDPLTYLPENAELAERVARLAPEARWALGERLAGNIKTHVVYAAPEARAARAEAKPVASAAVAHLKGAPAQAMGAQIAKRGGFELVVNGLRHRIALPKGAGRLIAAIDGRRSLGEIASAAGLDWMAFGVVWGPVHRKLSGFNLLHYSQGARR